MCRLPAGCTRHVQHTLTGLWTQSDDGEEGGGGLEHVVAREVFGRRADGDVAFKDLQPDVCPFADGLEVDAAVDEGLGEVAAAGAEGVRADGDGSGNFVGFEELDSLGEEREIIRLCYLVFKKSYL